MEIKDVRSASGTKFSDANITYPQRGKMSQTERSKVYNTNVELLSSGKVDLQGARPCAIIGPDRVLPPTTSEGYSKSGPDDLWSCPESYRQFYDHPIKMSDFQTSRNISPRQTFQENMQRIMVPPIYNSNKNSDESSLQNTKLNMPTEAKYCDVPFTLSNETKTVRSVDVPMSNVSPAFTRNIPPNGWQPGLSVRPLRPYPAPEYYQYPEYPNCAGTRPMPMVRSQRSVHEESAQSYSERLYQEANIRFKPYPTATDRYPQARYELITNCPTSFHPPAPYHPHKFDIHKSMQGHQYPVYPQVPLKYLERRMPESIMDGFQRPPNPHPNVNTFRNHMIPPPYGPIPGSCYQNKTFAYQSDSTKPVPLNKLQYDTNNKVYLDFDNTRNKVYPAPENFYYNDHSQLIRGDVVLPGHPVVNSRSQYPMYRKENSVLKNYEYASHYRNIDQSMNMNHSLSRLPLQFSPTSIAISPCDSNTSNETAHNLGTSQEDCGYVSQSSTTSLKSLDSCLANDMYKRYDYTPLISFHQQTNKNEMNSKTNINSSDKKGLDVRQFLQMWNEGDEEVSSSSKEAIQNKTTNFSSKYEKGNNQEQLYVLGLVNVPSEDLCKYDHLQKISKLPENIKGYNNIELLNQYEQLLESPTMSNFHVKSTNMKEFPVSTKNTTVKLPKEVLSRPLSPLDVEAKISQSVIHKEVGCNFEIKPCSPKVLNVDDATPVLDILGERIIEKVTNSGLLSLENDNKINSSVASIQPSCNLSNKQYSIDSIKANNYSLQDMDTNSSVCLASLPQLDNDIDLNFPEVNQQFINANKAETPQSKPLKNLTHINVDNKVELPQNHELLAHCVPSIGAEKETTKLSKYRKIKKIEVPSKEAESLYNRSSPMLQRTDSVIIKNPENIKSHEYGNSSSVRNSDINHATDTEKPYYLFNSTSNQISSNFTDDLSAETAIDFSINKIDTNIPDNDFNVKNSTDFLSTVLKNELNTYDNKNNVDDNNGLNLNSYGDKIDKVAENFKDNSVRNCNTKCNSGISITEDEDGKCDSKKENSLGKEVKNNANASDVNHCNNSFPKINCKDTPQNVCSETDKEQSNDSYNSLNSKVDVATKEIEQENNVFLKKQHTYVSEQKRIYTEGVHIGSLVCDNLCDGHTEEKTLNDIHENVKNVIFEDPEITKNNQRMNLSKVISEINITETLGINTDSQFIVQDNCLNALDTEEAPLNVLSVETEFTDNIGRNLKTSANNINQINSLNVNSTENEKVISSKIVTEINFGNDSEILNIFDKEIDDKPSVKACEIVFRDIKDISEINLDTTTNDKIVSSDIVSKKQDEEYYKSSNSETGFSIRSEHDSFNAPNEIKSELNESYDMDLKNMMDIIYNRTTTPTNKNSETALVENNEDISSKITTEAILGVLSESCDTKTEENVLKAHNLKIVGTENTSLKKPEISRVDSEINSKTILLPNNKEKSLKLNTGMCIEMQSGLETSLNEIYTAEFSNVTDELNYDQKDIQDHGILFSKNKSLHKNKPSNQACGILSEIECNNIDENNDIEKIENNTEIDTLELLLAAKNEVCIHSATRSSLNAMETDEVFKIFSNENIIDQSSNAVSNIKLTEEKYCEVISSKKPHPSRLTKSYPSKEYYSPWMQKLYLFTEGICVSLKNNIFINIEKTDSKDCIKIKNNVEDQEIEKIYIKHDNNIKDKQQKECVSLHFNCPEDKFNIIHKIANTDTKDKFDFQQSSSCAMVGKKSVKDSCLYSNNKHVSTISSHDTLVPEDKQTSNNITDVSGKYKLPFPFSDNSPKLQRKALKRSLSESALEDFSKNDTSEIAFVKRPKMISTELCNILQNYRRKSISEIYNEDNFFILIEDNNYILTDGNDTEKTCYTEVTMDSSETNNICNDRTIHMVTESEIKYCSETYESLSLIAPATINDIEEKTFDETWVEDVACVETIYSDGIAEDIEISTPVSPNSLIFSNCEHDIVSALHGGEVIDHMEKVKDIYGRNLCSNDAQIVETLFRTPQMNVNKTLVDNIESHTTEEIETQKVISFDTVQDQTLTVSNKEIPVFMSGFLSYKENDNTVVDDKENLKEENILQTDISFKCKSDIHASVKVCNQTHQDLGDYAVHSSATINDDIESSSENKRSPKYSMSSSPEVTSTTSEEKNSGIVLKISSYNGSRISRINEANTVVKNNKLSYKLTENMHYKSFHSNSSGVLITKAAQKYIPPLKETTTDLKVKLTLPQHSLIKLKELKKSKVEPKIDKKLPKLNNVKQDVNKKQKPKFEDVLMNIDKIQYKMHKKKTRKMKEEIPKVVIKKTESGAHYASSSSSVNDKFNPDLTGRKWQPWVFIEKNNFIDKMAVKNKQKAVFCHRKNSYVLSEKFRKYKSIYNAKFVITQPMSDDSAKGNLKYTIRLKHL